MALSQRLYDKISIKGKTPKSSAPLPRTYRGFSTISADSESYTLYDLALIKQDILNHFHIRQGERLQNPEFGTIIWVFLFTIKMNFLECNLYTIKKLILRT